MDADLKRVILAFLAHRYPSSYTTREIVRRLAHKEKDIVGHLNDLLKAGYLQATKDKLDGSIVWNCSPVGREVVSRYGLESYTRCGFSARRHTIYIAGQMAGLPENNFKAFFDAEARLMSDGWNPVNPARFDHVFGKNPTGKLLDACCESERAAIPYLDAIYLLKGWEKSKGAKRELAVALQHNLEVIVEVA